MTNREENAGVKLFRVRPPNSAAQKQFFVSKTRFTAYGGARGGGKSWALRTKAILLAWRYAGIRILILRQTYQDLNENHIQSMLVQLNGFAKYKESNHRFVFLNASSIKFGYCENEKDALRYQGQEYDVIMIDEATQFTEFQFEMLKACLRGVNCFPKRFYLTCNPGGVGHAWVKRLFVSKSYKPCENANDYTFIPAKVYDNVDLVQQDPDYVKMLESLPPDLRRAWLEGDWDVFVGQYFSQWRRNKHVIAPFEVPKHWARYFTMDYGLDMFAGYWVALDDSENAYVYREVYEGKDNYKGENGGGLLMSEAAQRILELTPQEETITAYFAPPDMWNKKQDTGRSTSDVFGERGIYLTRANNSRVQGWLELKEWLQDVQTADGKKKPKLQVFENCPNLIESMPNLVYDKLNPSDCAKEPHKYTHAPDALRYFVAGRPFAQQCANDEENQKQMRQMRSLINYGR